MFTEKSTKIIGTWVLEINCEHDIVFSYGGVVYGGCRVLDPWPSFTDTLLNVFLAIAVDNLANAQELTAAEEEQAEEENIVCTDWPTADYLAWELSPQKCRKYPPTACEITPLQSRN